MAIVQNLEEVEQALAWPGINLVGMELQASTKEDALFQGGLIQRLAEAGVFAWANAIKLRPHEAGTLFAGLDDNVALDGDPDSSWGEMFRKGIRVVQTDWPWQLSQYRESYFGKQGSLETF